MILAIETATPVCSVALGLDNGRVAENRIEGRGVHSERTFTFIEELLGRYDLVVGDLNGVLFSNGPGSYTGLRIGAAAIKGMLFRRDIPLYTLSTLTAFAVPFLTRDSVVIHSVIDARREHLYHIRCEKMSSGELVQSDPAVRELKMLREEIKTGEVVAGTGWEKIGKRDFEKIEWSGSENISAVNLIKAWNSSLLKPLFVKQKVDQFEPEYLTMSQVNNSSI